ncbi:Cyclin-D5-3, partial [Bienertia sinuspersici]
LGWGAFQAGIVAFEAKRDWDVAYSSIIYLDKFLSRKYIYKHQTWATILLSVACVSLSTKMEESKVPSLSEYKVEAFECGSSVI